MSTLDDSTYDKNVESIDATKAQILKRSISSVGPALSTSGQAKQARPPQSTLKDGSLPPRHLIRQFDADRALRDAEAAGLLTPRATLRKSTTPSPEIVALATVYVTAIFANTETPPSDEERIAKITEVASFYSEPQRQQRFKTLVDALFI